MAKIGIVYLSYNNQNYLERFLSPWINARANNLGGNQFVISAVSLPFKEYENMPGFAEDHVTYKMLETLIQYEKIDYLTTTPLYQTEAEARTAGMGPLLIENCDIVMLVDGDEYYTSKQIEEIFKFVEINKFISWFSVNFRNYVFTERHYLADLFIPPRIFKTKTNGFTISRFYFDNDIFYKSDLDGKEQSYKSLPHMDLPKSLIVNHYSWLSNENSKRKIEYQNKHFSHGLGCSYKWNNEANEVQFNEEYFKKAGLPLPIVMRESEK